METLCLCSQRHLTPRHRHIGSGCVKQTLEQAEIPISPGLQSRSTTAQQLPPNGLGKGDSSEPIRNQQDLVAVASRVRYRCNLSWQEDGAGFKASTCSEGQVITEMSVLQGLDFSAPLPSSTTVTNFCCPLSWFTLQHQSLHVSTAFHPSFPSRA